MDKIKVVLAAVKKHHFWVLCGVVVILSLVFWWTATAGLASRIEERADKLEATYTTLKGISTGGQHPNNEVIAAVKEQHKDLTDKVLAAWNILYRDQRARNQWPAQLGPAFRRHVELLEPEEEIPTEFRDTYMYFIRNHFPEMIEIVDVRLQPERDELGKIKKDEDGKPIKIDPFKDARGRQVVGGPGMYGGGGEYETGMPGGATTAGTSTARDSELVGKVDWNMTDLQRIRGDFYWQTQPTTTQVRLAQEDLWVYEALLRIIQRTNEGATGHYNAAVKTIQALEIGQRAAAAFAQGRVRGAGSGAGGMPMPGAGGYEGYGEGAGGGPMPGMTPGDMAGPGGAIDLSMYEASMAGETSGMPGGMPRAAGTAGASLEEQWKMRLLNGRYVDQDGMPLAASAPQPFAEFKMMPVRMFLVVDQRRIAKLLVNCANSTMPVEVSQVSINPGKGRTLSLGTMSGSGAGGYPSGPGGPGGTTGTEMYSPPDMYEGPGGPGGTMGDSGAMLRNRDQQTSYDLPVEIRGIIYIFNPPDREKLGTGSAAEGPTAVPSGVPVAPAAPPAGPPTGAQPAPLAAEPPVPPAGVQAAPPSGATAPPAGTQATPPAGEPTEPPTTPTPPAAPPPAGTANS